jgi:hypothetical protein
MQRAINKCCSAGDSNQLDVSQGDCGSHLGKASLRAQRRRRQGGGDCVSSCIQFDRPIQLSVVLEPTQTHPTSYQALGPDTR